MPKTERIGFQVQRCFVIQRYKPHRTKKGHLIWRRVGYLSGALTFDQFHDEADRLKACGEEVQPACKLHNKKLTVEEEIAFLAEEGQ